MRITADFNQSPSLEVKHQRRRLESKRARAARVRRWCKRDMYPSVSTEAGPSNVKHSYYPQHDTDTVEPTYPPTPLHTFGAAGRPYDRDSGSRRDATEATAVNESEIEAEARRTQDWRFGYGTPRSTYPLSALPLSKSFYGTPQTGIIGKHLPKEIVRVERDWGGGETCQFYSTFPMELDDRISPTQFQILINTLNAHLISAYSPGRAVIDNLLMIFTLHLSLLFTTGHFEQEVRKLEASIERLNKETFNAAGLNVLSPRKVAFQFLEIEYY